MYKAIILNPSWLFRLVWAFCKTFLDEHTTSKVILAPKGDFKEMYK